jgi:Rad3-related DNA helicase
MGTNLLDLDAIEWIGDIERFGMSVSRFLAAAYYQPDFDLAEQLLNVYHSLAGFADLLTRDRESHPVYADADRGVGGVICLDPSLLCREMFASFQSVIAFSGTLSPMDFYKSVLGFGERPVSAYDHPTSSTDKRSLITLIPGVDTRLKSRRGSARRIARILLRFVKMHSGGYLAVFPSFEYLNLVASYLADTGIELWLQYPEMPVGDRIQLRQALSRKSNTSLAMVVAGGQFTEAEDYAGDACVGIAIIGPCLSPPSIFAELLSQYWTNRGEDGFGVAYIYPGIRRVIQAGGRLLRNEDDRGVILLFDNRFLEEPYFSLLPDNWRSGLLSDCGSWHERVLEFWESTMVE